MRSKVERQEAADKLRELVKPGDTVYTVLRHVSRSGMMRVIDPVLIRPDGPFSLAGWAAVLTDSPLDRDRWGVKMGGCGMDMGFSLVYEISHALFPEGFTCIGDRCPSNDHHNGDRNYSPHAHKEGGYALRHKWL